MGLHTEATSICFLSTDRTVIGSTGSFALQPAAGGPRTNDMNFFAERQHFELLTLHLCTSV